MRLQAPQLSQPSAGQLASSTHLLSSSLMLPDSFGSIHVVGKTFSAYLGVLNLSFDLPVQRHCAIEYYRNCSKKWRMLWKSQPVVRGAGSLTINAVRFETATGLASKHVLMEDNNIDKITSAANQLSLGNQRRSVLDVFDSCGRIEPGEIFQYLFDVSAESEAAALRVIAFEDELGQARVTYHKTMGETGNTVVSPHTSFT
eukprot:scaffold58406_cov43-Cyclotella_meneghiniana.AAC.4